MQELQKRIVRTADRADQVASQHIRTAGSLPCIPVFTAGLNAVR